MTTDFVTILRNAASGEHDIRDLVHGLDLASITRLLKMASDELDDITEQKTKAQRTFDLLRTQVIPEMMDDLGLKSATVDGIGRIGLTSDAYVSVAAGQQQPLQEWLEQNGFGDLIKQSVNPSTLKAWATRRIKEGKEVPDMVKVTPYSRAAITKIS